jgi:probable F420-dependent oxidoreductase
VISNLAQEDDVTDRRFRFGLVSAPAALGGAPKPVTAREWEERARRAEDLGFSTLLLPDASTLPASFPYLAVAAAGTERLRLGNFVLPAPLRTAGSIAWDAATLDQLSGGRFELGLGAGRPGADADARVLGVPYGSAGERVRKVGEIIEAVRGVFADAIAGKDGLGSFQPVQRPAPPIMVAACGERLLTVAARQADIVAIQARTEADLRDKLRVVRDAAGDRFDELELSLNVFAIGDGELPPWLAQFGVDVAQAVDNQLLTVVNGDTATAVDVLKRRRDEFGISYVTFNEFALENAIPVVEKLAGQ